MRSLSLESHFICLGSCVKLTSGSGLEVESKNIDSCTGTRDVLHFMKKYDIKKYTLAVFIKSTCPKIIVLKFRQKKNVTRIGVCWCVCDSVKDIF